MVMLFEAEPSEEVEFSNDLLQITEYPTNRAYTHEQVADIFLNSSSVFAGKTKFAGIKIFQLSISFLQTHLLEILCDDTIDMILKKDVTMFLRYNFTK